MLRDRPSRSSIAFQLLLAVAACLCAGVVCQWHSRNGNLLHTISVSTARPACRVRAESGKGFRRSEFMRQAGRFGLTSMVMMNTMTRPSQAEQEAPFTGTTPIDKLVPAQKSRQRIELYTVMKEKIGAKVTSTASQVLQLVLLDALTRDKGGKIGGLDGDIQYQLDELKLSDLKKTVNELKEAQKAVNAEWKSEDQVTFTDTMIFAGYLKTAQEFKSALEQRSTNGGGATIASGFGNPFPIPPLGRPDAAGATGVKASSNVEDVVNSLKALGFSAKDIASLSMAMPGADKDFDGIESQLASMDDKIKGAIKSGQQSRKTVTQNAYQVNVGEAYNKLVTYAQARTDPLAYYYPAPKFDLKKVKL